MSTSDASSSQHYIPFSSLPLDTNGPRGNAWGRFGSADQLGTLNLLDPQTVKSAAASEIRTGIRISLDWPLNKPACPSFGRDPLKHEIKTRGKAGRPVNDDFLAFNTQISSQWDGFRHYGYLREKVYYNNTTGEQVSQSHRLGIDAWASAGGIVGRGILLDYARWATKHSIKLDPFTSSVVPLAHLRTLIAEQNINFTPGDILFIRSGFTAAFDALSDAEQRALPTRPSADFLGVESSEEMLKFLWENQFAAVAGDAPAFESSPVGGKDKEAAPSPFVLHEWLLGGWGTPIGEMFDLEELARVCEEKKRYSFFVSSVPLKVPGGVASPPNAVAIL